MTGKLLQTCILCIQTHTSKSNAIQTFSTVHSWCYTRRKLFYIYIFSIKYELINRCISLYTMITHMWKLKRFEWSNIFKIIGWFKLHEIKEAITKTLRVFFLFCFHFYNSRVQEILQRILNLIFLSYVLWLLSLIDYFF